MVLKRPEHIRDLTEPSVGPSTSLQPLTAPCLHEYDNEHSAPAIAPFHLWNLTSPHLPSQPQDSEALLLGAATQTALSVSDLPTVADPVDSANRGLVGKKVLLTIIQRISTQVYQRFLAEAVGEMLRGTLYEGFTPEHLPTLLQASQDFYNDEADLSKRLARLHHAVSELPDESFFESGHHLKDALQLCVAVSKLLRDITSSDSVPEKAISGHRHFRNLLETLLDNSLLKTWSTLSGARDIIEKSLQLFTETAPLMTPDISFDQVMNWASQSPLLKHLMTDHYQGITEIFYELGILANLLRLRQTTQPDASTLSHGAWLLEVLDSNQLGPLITGHLSHYLAPFFTSLHNMAKALANPNRFPADTSGLAPFKWLSDSNVLEVLPAPLKALVYRFIEALGNTDSLRLAVGEVPANGKISDLCRWLMRALEQPKFELIATAVMDIELFNTLSRWSNQAVLLHRHCAEFAGVENGPAAVKWSLTLLKRLDLPLLAQMLPAVLHERLANWLMPLLQGLQLAPLLEEYPHYESQMAQLSWGAHLLVSEQATPFLTSFLPQSLAQQLVKPFEFIRQTTTFPSDDSYTAQLQWSINLLASPTGQSTLQQFAPEGYDYLFTHLHSVNTMIHNTEGLRALLMDNAPWQSKAQQLFAVLSPPLIEALKSNPELLISAASWASGGNKTAIGLSLTTLRFYLTMPSHLSTTERLIWILKNSAYEAINEYSTVLAWLVTHGNSASTVLSHAEQTRRIYSARSQPEKLEAELDELVKMLNRDMPLPPYLKPLLNTLPALPALIRAQQHYTTLPHDMPVEEQTLHMAQYLSQSDSAALTRLYDSIETYAVGGISHGLHMIAKGVYDPLKFPAASASLSNQPVNKMAKDKVGGLSTQTKLEVFAGSTGLVVSVLGGVWAWKHWGKSDTQAYSSPYSMAMSKLGKNNQDSESDSEDEDNRTLKKVYKTTTQSIPSKHDPAKIALAFSVLGFIASSGLLIKGVTDALNTPAKELTTLITTLDALEERTHNDLKTGHSDRLLEDIDHYVEELSSWLDEQTYADLNDAQADPSIQYGVGIEQPTTAFYENSVEDETSAGYGWYDPLKFPAASAAALPQNSQITSWHTPQDLDQNKVDSGNSADLASSHAQDDNGARLEPGNTEDLQPRADEVLTLMRWAVRSLSVWQSMMEKKESGIKYKLLIRRLAKIKSKLVALRKDLVELNMDPTAKLTLSQEISAYSLLDEMRAFYADSNNLNLWKNFDPDAVFTYEYSLEQKRIVETAPLINLVSGSVNEQIKKKGATGSFNLGESYKNLEVTPLITTGISLYVPGEWTKKRALHKAGIEASQGGSLVIPKMTDAVKEGTNDHYGNFRIVVFQNIDSYLTFKKDKADNPQSGEDPIYQWPLNYSATLIETLMSEAFLTAYFSGYTLTAETENRQQNFRQYMAYTLDDALYHSHLIIQNSLKSLIQDSHGTPAGLTEKSVLTHAIRFSEAQLDLYKKNLNAPAKSVLITQVINNNIANMLSVLRVLYQFPNEHLRLERPQTPTDAIMLAFAESLWTDPILAARINNHTQLKNLGPQSPLIVKQLNDTNTHTRFTMPFAYILCKQHEQFAPPASVIWPNGLSYNDPLLQTLIDHCSVYRAMIPDHQQAEKNRDSLFIPTTMTHLQDGLNRVIREKAPPSAQHLRQRLDETLNVKFIPTSNALSNPNLKHKNTAAKVINISFSVAQIMAKAHKNKLRKLSGYVSYQVISTARFPTAVITELETVDWQVDVQRKIQGMSSDLKLKELWKNVFTPLVTEKMKSAGVAGGATLKLDDTLIPGVYMLTTAKGVELHSLFNTTTFKATNLERFNQTLRPTPVIHNNEWLSFPQNVSPDGKKLYNWLNEHRPDSERKNNNIRNTLSLKEPRYPTMEDASMIALSGLRDYLDGMKKDADAYLKSNAELFVHNVFLFFNNVIAPLLTVLAIPISGPLAYLIAAGLVSLPFAELAVADNEEEFNDIFLQASLNLAADVLPAPAIKLLSTIPAKQIAQLIAKKAGVVFDVLKGPKYIKTATTNIAMPIQKIGPANAIRDAVRTNIITTAPNAAFSDYAGDILNKGNVLSKVHADEFSNGLKLAANYKSPGNTGNVDHLFTNVRTLTSSEQMLQVKQGEVIVFMQVDPNSPLKQLHPIHAMPALGNGRFAGLNNMVLDPAMGPGKRILTAEQLGSFDNNLFTKAGSLANETPLQIKVGYPKNSTLAPVPTLHEAATKLAKNSHVESTSADYIADIMQNAGELAAEQSQAFKEFANLLMQPANTTFSLHLNKVVRNVQPVETAAQLKSIPKGQILIIAPTDFSAKNMLLSLGNNKFAGSHLDQLSPWLPKGKFTVSADELGALMSGGKIGNQVVKAGPINLQGLRNRALLGRDSFTTFNSGVLTIRAHGQRSIVNYLDASELADIIRGIMSKQGGMNAVTRIELESCYGAMGKISTSESLSVILGKNVKAYPYRFNTRIPLSTGRQGGKGPINFSPPASPATGTAAEKLAATSLALNTAKSNMKSHDRWTFWLSLLKRFPKVSRSRRNVDESTYQFEQLLNNAHKLVMHTSGFDTASFLESQPDYFSDSDSLNPSTQSALTTELAVIVAYPIPDNADEFAERMMLVLTLTEPATKLLDDYLEKNQTPAPSEQIPRA